MVFRESEGIKCLEEVTGELKMLVAVAPSTQAIAVPQKMRFQAVWTRGISQQILQVPSEAKF